MMLDACYTTQCHTNFHSHFIHSLQSQKLKVDHSHQPEGIERVKIAKLDWWAVIQTLWKLSEEIWRWETRHRAHVLSGRWEVRGHIVPMWLKLCSDDLWEPVENSQNVLLWDRVHTFHQMEIPSASKDITGLFTWMQNTRCISLEQDITLLIMAKADQVTRLWKPHVSQIILQDLKGSACFGLCLCHRLNEPIHRPPDKVFDSLQLFQLFKSFLAYMKRKNLIQNRFSSYSMHRWI